MRWSVSRDSDVLTVMTALIWMLTWLPQVLSAVTVLPQPVNVVLKSNNLRHMLRWQPGPSTPSGVHYNVSFRTDKGTSWIPVAGCEMVQHPLECILTDVLNEPRTCYYVQLEAKLGKHSSDPVILDPFTPFIDSQLDPPLLTVTSCGRDLCVDLQPPEEGLRQFYDDLQYKLMIDNSSATFLNTKGLGKQVLKNLSTGRQNCVSVCLWDNLESKKFNYSKPVCVFIPDVYSADKWISGVLCLLVMVMLVFGLLLFLTGFICQRRKPLPNVLETIRHMEKEQVIVSCHSSTSSLLNIETAAPSSGEKGSSQPCSDGSDEESETESIDSYTGRVGVSLLLSNSHPSSSPSPTLDPQPSVSSNRTSVTDSSQPHVPGSTETTESSAGRNYTLNTDTGSLTGDSKETEKKEQEVVIELDSQDVNLLTLTFGRRHEEEEEEEQDLHHDPAETEPESDCVTKEHSIAPTQPSHTLETKESSCSAAAADDDDNAEEEEEEEEDYSGYMGRPCSHVLQNLL